MRMIFISKDKLGQNLGFGRHIQHNALCTRSKYKYANVKL